MGLGGAQPVAMTTPSLVLIAGSLALKTGLQTVPSVPRTATVVLPARLALSAQQELDSLKEEVGPNLAAVRAGNGWCFSEAELGELRHHKERFVDLIDYLKPREQAHLVLCVEMAYQARMATGKVDKLRHVLAVARVLLTIRSEAGVVEVRAPPWPANPASKFSVAQTLRQRLHPRHPPRC